MAAAVAARNKATVKIGHCEPLWSPRCARFSGRLRELSIARFLGAVQTPTLFYDTANIHKRIAGLSLRAYNAESRIDTSAPSRCFAAAASGLSELGRRQAISRVRPFSRMILRLVDRIVSRSVFSVGEGAHLACCRDLRRVRPARGRGHRHASNPTSRSSKAGGFADRLCSRWRGTRLAPASSPALRDRAATSPACQTWEVISLNPSGVNFSLAPSSIGHSCATALRRRYRILGCRFGGRALERLLFTSYQPDPDSGA
jgi:hypothetical protein